MRQHREGRDASAHERGIFKIYEAEDSPAATSAAIYYSGKPNMKDVYCEKTSFNKPTDFEIDSVKMTQIRHAACDEQGSVYHEIPSARKSLPAVFGPSGYPSLHIDLIEARFHDALPTTTAALREPVVQNGASEAFDQYGLSKSDSRPGSSVGATKERRHQIPGLRQTPYLKLFFLRCSDVEVYRNTHRKQIREWLKNNTPPSQNTASLNTQGFHDAFEWLIVHVVLPDDGRSILRAANSNKSDTKASSQGSAAVTEKVRADFNSTSKAAVDRVAQVQITRASETAQVANDNQEPLVGWTEFISKAKTLVLTSFDLRVTQYEEDIKERDAQRNIPGWNFNTFFVLKEGLARGFESVGLVEDALSGYQELALGLTSIIEIEDNEGQRGDHFKSYTDDLSAELKQALQSNTAQHQRFKKTFSALPEVENGQSTTHGDALGSNILDINRKPFRELILANEISIFDFRCYLFAKEVLLLLRLANASVLPDLEESSSNGGLETAQREPQDLLLLAEVCRRATEFLAAAGRTMRDDLRSSIHPLSRGHTASGLSSVSTFDDTIEDIVASWTFSAAQCILVVTRTQILITQLQPLLRNLRSPEEAHSPVQNLTRGSNRDELPRRTSSLPVHPHNVNRPSSPDKFPTITSLDAARLLPPTSSQTGTQELAAQRAELEVFKRRVVVSVGLRHSKFRIDTIQLRASGLFGFDDMEEIALDGTAAHTPETQNDHATLSVGVVNGLRKQDSSQVPESSDTFSKAYEVISSFLPKTDKRLHLPTAASYFHQLASFYYNNDWMRLEIPMLDMYAHCLKYLDRRKDFCQAGLQLLARLISLRGLSYGLEGKYERQNPVAVGRYMQDVIDASGYLQQPIPAPLHSFFGQVSLDPYIRHFDDRDGFRTWLHLQNLMAAAFEAQEVRVKIIGVDADQHCEIWLETETSEVLQPGLNSITVQTTTMSPGWYNLEKIEIRAANIMLFSDCAARGSKTYFGSPVENDIADQVYELERTPILVWPDEKALSVRLALSRSIHLGRPRSVDILVSSGRNRITRGRLVLRACSAGLRLRTADAEVRSGNVSLVGKSQPGSLDLGPLDAGSGTSISIPYGLEGDLADIKLKVEFTYIVDLKEYLHINSGDLNIQLPLNVNVQDSFQRNALFSNFMVGTANSIPTRISEYDMPSTETLDVSMSRSTGGPLEVFGRQPLSLVAKIQRFTSVAQTIPTHAVSSSTLLLRIRYACLNEEVGTAVEHALSEPLRKSEFRDISPLLSAALRKATQSILTIHDLETIGLLHEIPIATFDQCRWDPVLSGLRPERRTILVKWLRDWHAKHYTISLPQEIDTRNLLDLVVPVEIPHVPIVVEARLDIRGCSIRHGDIPVAALDQSLFGEITLRYSQYWARKPDQGSSDDSVSITYEMHANSDIWLIGGQRKAQFSVKAEETCRVSIILLPQRIGHLPYPSLEVRVTQGSEGNRETQDMTGTTNHDIACELDYLNQAESILIVPNLSTSTASLDANNAGGGAWLVESKSRSER
ncbi:MAG: hypothetical protein Q9218_003784 [Villophora microphyllina]